MAVTQGQGGGGTSQLHIDFKHNPKKTIKKLIESQQVIFNLPTDQAHRTSPQTVMLRVPCFFSVLLLLWHLLLLRCVRSQQC